MINEVYQTVLAIANKEQRGYITPQEFNLFANQAQNSIFEQYFYDLDVAKRLPFNNDYNSKVNLIEEKIYPFKFSETISDGDFITSLPAFYRLAEVYQKGDNVGEGTLLEEIDAFDVIRTQNSPLTKATSDRPVYYIEFNKIKFIPEDNTKEYEASYITKPNRVNWTYIVVNGKPLYNPASSSHNDFSLIKSEQHKLVVKILQLSGILLEDNPLVQAATAEEVKNIQLEKQ